MLTIFLSINNILGRGLRRPFPRWITLVGAFSSRRLFPTFMWLSFLTIICFTTLYTWCPTHSSLDKFIVYIFKYWCKTGVLPVATFSYKEIHDMDQCFCKSITLHLFKKWVNNVRIWWWFAIKLTCLSTISSETLKIKSFNSCCSVTHWSAVNFRNTACNLSDISYLDNQKRNMLTVLKYRKFSILRYIFFKALYNGNAVWWCINYTCDILKP